MLFRRSIAVFISAIMVFTMVLGLSGMETVHAATAVGTVIISGGTTKSYSKFEQLVDYVDDLDKKTFTIEMKTDWNAAKSSDFDRTLIIPSDSKVTLNMHGRVFSRNNSWDKGDECSDGELIKVKSGATLTVNGASENEEKEVEHKQIPVHKSCASGARATGRVTIYGGLLCGGASTNGSGGIHVKEDATVKLNDVTIAGCRSEENDWWFVGGYGGGIYLSEENSNLYLNNSRITGCYAEISGGGICTDNEDYINIELKNSVIDGNYSYEEGGGVRLDGEHNVLRGDQNSSISGNESATKGGGIYSDNENTTMAGLEVKGNKAKNGGGIYTEKENTSLTDLTITDNYASERGGGLYIWDDANTFTGCVVTGNHSRMSGGGVYVDSGVDVDFNVTGRTIVKDNKSDFGKEFGNNFYMSDDDPEKSRIMFNLASGSDVRVCYYNTAGKGQIMVTMGKVGDQIKSPDCTRFLTSENDGYYFDYLPLASQRKIVLKKGSKKVVPDPVGIPSSEAVPKKVGTVGAGGGNGSEYDLIRGYFIHQKTDSYSGDEDRNSVFYYSDGLFYGDSDDPQYTYNNHLATLSLSLAFGAMYLERSEKLLGGTIYYNKHAGGRQFLADIGCPDDSIYVNDSMVSKPGSDSIGVIIGSKELKNAAGEKTGEILIPVTFRGGGYELEWASNVTLGTAKEKAPTKEAKGFSSAADQALVEINKYLDKYDLRDEYKAGKVKFWVCGYSRAGATANLTSKRLVDRIAVDCDEGSRSKVFGYTCEAPKGGTDEAEKDGLNYNCIHNMINTADVVPLVAPEEMGFKRYGVDHYIPGSDEVIDKPADSKTVTRGGEEGVTTVTTRSDNTAMRTKGAKENDAESKAYNSQRDKMMEQLLMIDSGITFNDYFHPMHLTIPSMSIGEIGTYDGTRVEDFLPDFLRLAQAGDEQYGWSRAIESRDKFARDKFKLNNKEYSTIQESLQDAMSLVFGMPSEDMGSFTAKASTILKDIKTISLDSDDKTLVKFLVDVFGTWHLRPEKEKEEWITFIWDKLKGTEALDVLSDTDRANLHKDWPTIADFALHLLDADLSYVPGKNGKSWAAGSELSLMYLITFVTYADYILSNHYPEINLAWARTYDSWYQGETSEYVVTPPDSVKMPAAYIKKGDKTEKLLVGTPNFLSGDQKIMVDNDEVNGEAVYYDLYETTPGDGAVTKVITENHIYRGGIDLSLDGDSVKYYRLRVYDMSYGVRSEKEQYRIKMTNNRHPVYFDVIDESGKEKTIECLYSEGQKVTTQALVPDELYFDHWKVTRLDKDGNVEKADITKEILGDNAENEAAVFTMPEMKTYEEGYGLRFTASYGTRVKEVTYLGPDPPRAGAKLQDSFFSLDDTNKEVRCTTGWTYKDSNGDICPAAAIGGIDSVRGYNDTVYYATVTIPQDKANGAVFASDVDVKVTDRLYEPPKVLTERVKRNDADGSITVVLECMPTQKYSDVYDRPESNAKFRVGAWDLNLEKYDEDAGITDYSAVSGSHVEVTAPNVPGEVFEQWDLRDTGITLTKKEGNVLTNKTIMVDIPANIADDNIINAEYMPVVKKIEINMYDENGKFFAPSGNEGGPARIEAFGTVSNVYEVDPDDLELTWSPEPVDGRFHSGTKYEATVSLKNDPNSKVRAKIKESNTEYMPVNLHFHPADNMEVTFNGKSDESVQYSLENLSVTKIYPEIKVSSVGGTKNVSIDNVTGIPFGASESDAKDVLQQTATIYLDNNMSREVPVNWEDAVPDKPADSMEQIIWTVTGMLEIPDDIDPNSVNPYVKATVTVNGPDAAQTPEASLGSGTYRADQVITLDTTGNDGTTYYTTDGSDPAENGMVYHEGDEIMFSRDDIAPDEDGIRRTVLKTCTRADGKLDSAVSTYHYVFDNEIPVPERMELQYNSLEQTGVEASRFYTIEEVSEGASINEKGDAVATEPGTYTAKLKLADKNYKWLTSDGTETEDKTVSFAIHPISVQAASVSGIKNKTYTGKKLKQDLEVTLPDYAVTLKEGKDYTVSYEDNVGPGIARVKIEGTGGLTGDRTFKYNITTKTKLTSAKAKKGRKAVIRWKKAAKASGYQIRYSTNKKFKKAVKTVRVKKAKVTKKTIRKLKARKTYYVQIRTFNKVVDKETGKRKTIYSSWSKTKKFKSKK